MKGTFVCGRVIVGTLLCCAWPVATVIASDASQADPHPEVDRTRAQLHLHTMDVATNDIKYAVAIPNELKPFVGEGEIPVYVDKADLEGTGRLDYVLVVGTEDSGDKIMRIISRAPSGALSVVLSRSDALVCDECRGMSGGTSIGLGKGAIEIQNSQGSAGGGGEVTCLFRYNKASHQWLLVDRIDFVWSINTQERSTDTGTQHQVAKDIGVISLAGAEIFDRCF